MALPVPLHPPRGPPCPERLSRSPADVTGPAQVLVTSQVSVDVILSQNPFLLTCPPPAALPLTWPPAGPEGPREPAWPQTRRLQTLSRCQPASVFTGRLPFLAHTSGSGSGPSLGSSPAPGWSLGRGAVATRECRAHTAPLCHLAPGRPLACLALLPSGRNLPPARVGTRGLPDACAAIVASSGRPATPHPACKPPPPSARPPGMRNTPVWEHTCLSAWGFPSTPHLPCQMAWRVRPGDTAP